MSVPVWLQNIARSLVSDDELLLEANTTLEYREKIIQTLSAELTNKDILIFKKNDDYQLLFQEYERLKSLVQKFDPLEETWNNKRPKATVLYRARQDCNIDVRQFINPVDDTLPFFGGSNDEKALKCLEWVKKNIKYVPEKSEYWKFAWETIKDGGDDCDGGAILLHNLMLRSEIPYWRIRLNCGDVKGGGHAWITYLRESDNQWYILDWCYWPEESKGFKKTWKSAEKYFKIWFSWNSKYCFNNDNLDREDFKVTT